MLSSNLHSPNETSGDESAIRLRGADWLRLAAAPTFAIMALVTGVQGGGSTVMLCSAAGGMSALNGMAPMYVLMSAFHMAPWLRFISSRRGAIDARRSHT